MKLIIFVACAFVAVAVAAPAEQPAEIVSSEFETNPDGSYIYGFKTSDGVVREETGEVKEALDEENKPHPVVVVRGSYSYIGPDGQVETINYSADENGFKAEGDSIPQAPVARR